MGTSIAEGLRTKMIAASIGVADTVLTEGSWPIHIGRVPTRPNACIIITRTPGRSPNPKWALDYPAFQIRVRGPQGNYESAELKTQAVKDLFLGFTSADVDNTRWVSITMPADFSFIGYDENDRPNFSLNLQMITEPLSASGTNREVI